MFKGLKQRKISLMEEILFNINLWKDDEEYEKLPLAVCDSFNVILTEASLQKQSQLACSDVGTKKVKLSDETNKYVAVFKEKYLEFTNFNSDEEITPLFRITLKAFVEDLIVQGSSSIEYLEWFFEVFAKMENNKKYMPPALSFTVKDWVKKKFLFDNKETLALRRRDLETSNKKARLVDIASNLFQNTQNQDLGQKIIGVAKGNIPISTFHKDVLAFAKKYNFTEFVEELENLK